MPSLSRFERQWLQGLRRILADEMGTRRFWLIVGWASSIAGGVCIGLGTTLIYRMDVVWPAALVAVGGYMLAVSNQCFNSAKFALFAKRYVDASAILNAPEN